MRQILEITTKSDKETRKIGTLLAKNLLDWSRTSINVALVLSLEGDLGAGKTTFAQGFAKGLGVKETPRSPTFVIMQMYKLGPSGPRKNVNKISRSRESVDIGNLNKFKNFIHIDAYRIGQKDIKTLGWKDFVKNQNNIVLVEWGDRIKGILSKGTLHIKFKHIGHPQHRLIEIWE